MPATYRASAELAAIREHVLTRAAATRGTVFRRSDLKEWGVDPGVIDVMRRRRWWVRLHHGVFVDSTSLEAASTPQARHRIHAAATLAAIAGPAYLFATTASLTHGLTFDRDILDRVHILRPTGQDCRALRRRLTGKDRLDPPVVHVHAVPDGDLTEVDGLPTVDRPLAALSTAALADPEWALVTLDAACWQSPETLQRLTDLAEEWGHLRGIGTVRRALPLVRTGAQTPLETLSRVRLTSLGLPEPRLQVPLHDADGLIGYVDMLWEEWGVVGEADGALKYGTGQVLFDEKRREDRIRALGYIVVRWTWDEIFRDPQRVVARIQAAAALYQRQWRRQA
jgi:hypothetical protein